MHLSEEIHSLPGFMACVVLASALPRIPYLRKFGRRKRNLGVVSLRVPASVRGDFGDVYNFNYIIGNGRETERKEGICEMLPLYRGSSKIVYNSRGILFRCA